MFPTEFCFQSFYLFNDAFSSSDYTAPDNRMINEPETIWKEAVLRQSPNINLEGLRWTTKNLKQTAVGAMFGPETPGTRNTNSFKKIIKSKLIIYCWLLSCGLWHSSYKAFGGTYRFHPQRLVLPHFHLSGCRHINNTKGIMLIHV
jgi:hypothetical protein